MIVGKIKHQTMMAIAGSWLVGLNLGKKWGDFAPQTLNTQRAYKFKQPWISS